MALIGKDGKDDGAIRNFLRTLEGVDSDDILPEEIQARRLAQVTLVGTRDLSYEEHMRSDAYWEQARQYGLVDSTIRFPGRDTVVVLSVCDKEEAEQLVQNHPMVSEGEIRPRWKGEMQWLSDDQC